MNGGPLRRRCSLDGIAGADAASANGSSRFQQTPGGGPRNPRPLADDRLRPPSASKVGNSPTLAIAQEQPRRLAVRALLLLVQSRHAKRCAVSRPWRTRGPTKAGLIPTGGGAPQFARTGSITGARPWANPIARGGARGPGSGRSECRLSGRRLRVSRGADTIVRWTPGSGQSRHSAGRAWSGASGVSGSKALDGFLGRSAVSRSAMRLPRLALGGR
jgi:hypothetical protein